jgi:hypothetical protein
MVFFAEIAFIYGGNDSSEEDVFGSEKSSEKIIKSSETTAISSGTGSGTHLTSSWTSQAAKTSMGTAIQQRLREKHTRIRFKCDFCEKTTKIALKNGLNIDWGNNLFVY